jgi:signal transduction histidine kinase
LEALRRQDHNAAFIFLTALDDRDHQRAGMNRGADDYLTKPFTIAELREAVYARLAHKSVLERRVGRLLDELRHNISVSLPHELHTAIGLISGYAYLMLDDAALLTPDHVQMVTVINESARRLERIADKFLWYSQTSFLSRKVYAARISRHADETIWESATVTAQQFRRSVDVAFDLASAAVAVPPECLARLVLELIENSCKFSLTNTPIHVTGHADDTSYILKIRDQGRGMTAEQIARVGGFMQFERDVHEQQGLGLGLSIVKGIVDAFDGRLSIHSVPQHYTSVEVCLPLEVAVSPPNVAQPEVMQPASS